jgi:hypothetical protein
MKKQNPGSTGTVLMVTMNISNPTRKMKLIAISHHGKVNRLPRSVWAAFILSLAFSVSSCRHYAIEIPKQPEEEMAMKPYADAVWVSGDWEWKKDHHEFKKGYYNPPHRNGAYVPGQWKHSSKGYYYVRGNWKKSGNVENDAVKH